MPSISIGLVLSVLACVASWEQFAVHGVVIGAAVLPHGDFVYDPTLVGRGSLRVHNAALKAGAFIDGLQPDIIVLTTPHGMTLDSQLALYGDTQAGGFANIGQDLHNKSAETYRIRANVTLATNITAELAESLGPLAAKLSMFGGSEQMPLRWGEVIPLSFIPNRRRTKVIVLSLPNRRHDGSGAAMADDLLTLGTKLFKFFHSRTERTAMLLSSDLAHTHSKTGPYGFTHAAAPFDTAIRRWAVDPIRNSHSLLKRARSLVARALSCGYPSLVIWHAMMNQLPRSHWECGSVAYAAPTYYGMLVATFRNVNDAGQSQGQPHVQKPLREWELE